MPRRALDDDLVMSLVETALSRPASERRAFLEAACGGDTELLETVSELIEAEERMGDFLRPPCWRGLEPENPLTPGQTLEGRFRIEREVARGGMGIVYEAFDMRLQHRIALKCARTGFSKRLPPEVRSAIEINHPNVCRVFEIHTADTPRGELDFFTMEFLDGQTLAHRLRGGALAEREARTIARQLCEGLAAAHRKHIVHGDLKTSNVILAEEAGAPGRAVITDFGLARRPEAPPVRALPSVAGGTVDYMAPELLAGAKPTAASDIYALGVLLREMVQENRNGATHVPHARWEIAIRRCLDPVPQRRYADAEAVAEALDPPSRRWMLAAAAAVLIAAASGLASYRTAIAPKEQVRLMVEAGDLNPSLAPALHAQLAALRGAPQTGFTFLPDGRAAAEATHRLGIAARTVDGKLRLQASITDVRSRVRIRDWSASYSDAEQRYIPTALAGVVTGTFHLPAASSAEVNAPARLDYQTGLDYLRRKSSFAAALAPLQRAVAADPDSPLTHAALAEAAWVQYRLFRKPDWLALAESEVLAAELRNPDVPEVLAAAGLLQTNSGHFERAQAAYARAVEIDAKYGDAYRRLGVAYQSGNDPTRALDSFRRAIDAEPNDYRNYQALGTFQMRAAQYDDAVSSFAKSVGLAPMEPTANFILGSAYSMVGRFADAERFLRTSIDLEETPDALTALGFCLAYQGRDQEALFYIKRSIQYAPNNYVHWMNLGTAYRRLGLLTDSRASYQKALELAQSEIAGNPRDAYARACVAYCSAWLGDPARAASEAVQALRLDPGDSDMLRMTIKTHEALGNREESLKLLRSAPKEVIDDLGRLPDLADLHRDSRFQILKGAANARTK